MSYEERQEALIGIRDVLVGNEDEECRFACGPYSHLLREADPGLRIDGLGSTALKLPLEGKQLQQLEKVCEPAKFGHGTETRTDAAVRNSLQLSADRVHICNTEWNTMLQQLIDKEVKKALGIEKVRREQLHAPATAGPGAAVCAQLQVHQHLQRLCSVCVHCVCMFCFIATKALHQQSVHTVL